MIDISGLNELVADLTRSPIRLQAGALKVVEQVSRKGAEDARRFAPRKGLPHYAATITHEASWERGQAVGEFGPEARGQGNLGHILEAGTATSPPHAHVGPAFDIQSADFVQLLGNVDLL